MGTTDYELPDRELELLARMLLPEIKREFELWQAQQESNISSNKE